MVRAYRSTLHQLCDAGPRKKGNWDKVLTYVHQNSSSDGGGGVSVPSASLVAEALSREGSRDDETPLRVCASRAPSRVVAALIRVAPEATRIADADGRTPLHLACRRPTGGTRDGSRASPGADAEAVLRVLVEICPEALARRDVRGRTPLHALLAHHAHSRARSTVELLSRALPAEAFAEARSAENDAARSSNGDPLAVELTDDGESAEVTAKSHFAFSLSMKDAVPVPTPDGEALPFNAAIVPDDDGRLPLHIAAEEGATRESIKALVRAYPGGVAKGDRDGRTPLHLYLDAGFPYDVGSEDTPPPPPRSTNVIASLLTDEVARAADHQGRLPLHAACRSLALSILLKPDPAESADDAIALSISAGLGARGGGDKEGSVRIRAVRMLIDANRDAVLAGNREGRAPLHAFLGAP